MRCLLRNGVFCCLGVAALAMSLASTDPTYSQWSANTSVSGTIQVATADETEDEFAVGNLDNEPIPTTDDSVDEHSVEDEPAGEAQNTENAPNESAEATPELTDEPTQVTEDPSASATDEPERSPGQDDSDVEEIQQAPEDVADEPLETPEGATSSAAPQDEPKPDVVEEQSNETDKPTGAEDELESE